MILVDQNFENILYEAVSEGEQKKYYLRGIFMESNTKNRNGRIYDLEEMSREVSRVNEMAKLGNHVLGELDHPNGRLEISLKDASHKIIEMRMEGNRAVGKAHILEHTPMGQIAIGLIKDGVKLGVSSRGTGTLCESTGRVKNFNLKTIDIVATPSCVSAVPETIYESIQMYKRGEVVTDLAEAVINDPVAQKYFEIEMRKFIESLKSKK